ncbi:MAG: hypothetical protein C0606_16345 [Hyphomicrobiales bacterium]|mgnify:CR=1 FL=1|nr:MAG: hypothetical protein C0606_16345 [Hyphomicrobiales bacterium]
MMAERYAAKPLAGKVVLVTGGKRGIGLATARLARLRGAHVAVCDCPDRELPVDELDRDTLFLEGDVSMEDDCERFVSETVAHFGRIDVLVNNAGIVEPSRSTLRQDLETWRRVIDVNLQAVFLMARAAARAMVEQGIAGAIVNVSSIVGLNGFRANNAYGPAKAGVAMLTKTLSNDLARTGIRVNAVAPGFTNTRMTEKLGDTTPVHKEAFLARIPLGRFGEAEEIAAAILFLGSDEASYVTGAVLPIDGGWAAFGGPSEETAA